MAQTVGVGIIIYDEKQTIGECLKSLIDHVDQIVVVGQNGTSKETEDIIKSFPKVEYYNFGDWVNDFAAKRNYCFSKLHTDWILWVDADDTVIHPENLRKLAENALPDVGAIWFAYDYAQDEFGNTATIYERERLLRASFGWVWKGRLHETVSPVKECKYVRADDVVVKHHHNLNPADRNVRNFTLLDTMHKEDPDDLRVWLYFGHQHFAAGHFKEAAKWYLKFGTSDKAIPLERYQALNYASKALRNVRDNQAIECALMAIALQPQYKDGYLELAQSYLTAGDYDKCLHWAKISDTKGVITEPPHVIFINPLDYTFNKHCMIAECYLKKNDYENALKYLNIAYAERPIKEVAGNITYVSEVHRRNRVMDAVKMQAVDLLNNKELIKLKLLADTVPFWMKDTPDYAQLVNGINQYTQNIKSDAKIDEGANRSAKVNVKKVIDVPKLLETLDKKYSHITFECPFPEEDSDQFQVMSVTDVEQVITSVPGRHILNLRQDNNGVWGEYDKNLPKDLSIRMFLGQGLETWTPETIKSIGCGGSETSAAWLMREFANLSCQPILYAMDNQVYDGVIYRGYNRFQPDSPPCHLFVSSRVPELFDHNISAVQKWLWFHDIHRWDRLTPERASEIDVIVVLSKWHANFTKATYPFLKDAEVIDMDNMPMTYDDCVATEKWHEVAKCRKLPKIAIIGDAIDPTQFKEITEKRIPNRFIWCSSPDRGLEQVLALWPMILRHLPSAELKIFYGWDYFDHATGIPAYAAYKDKILEMLKQPGVEWCGRIGQDQLAKELQKADAMLYPPPHDFRETYGIAFVEAQAAGCLVFYRQNGALGETIGDRGIPLALNATPEEIVGTIVENLSNPEHNVIIRNRAREWALNRTWSAQAGKWMELYRRMTDGSYNSHKGNIEELK
jgi:glycosyltransferase involved in cell wall biosynthesis